MKTKRTIYFLLIIIGAITMGFGEKFTKKEYALGIGIVLLLFGIYKSSRAWGIEGDTPKENSEKKEL